MHTHATTNVDNDASSWKGIKLLTIRYYLTDTDTDEIGNDWGDLTE